MSADAPHLATLFPLRSGQRFDLAWPTPDMVTIDDIAWALAHTLRYGGHSQLPINVASHSINVGWLVAQSEQSAEVRLAALLHDAHEAYIGDVIRPLKKMLGREWQDIEERVDEAIADRFHLAAADFRLPAVRHADAVSYCWERRDLVGVRAWDETLASHVPDRRCPNLSSADAYRHLRDELTYLSNLVHP